MALRSRKHTAHRISNALALALLAASIGVVLAAIFHGVLMTGTS